MRYRTRLPMMVALPLDVHRMHTKYKGVFMHTSDTCFLQQHCNLVVKYSVSLFTTLVTHKLYR
jgi:hypothetical protein